MAEVAIVRNIIEGGQTLRKTINSLVDKMVSPALQALQNEISRIDLEIEGLHVEEKLLVTHATENLLNSKTAMTAVKRVLNALADETIKVAEKLKRYVAACSKEDMSEVKIKRIIGKAAEQMCHILQRSQVILAEAKEEYTRCELALNGVKAKLETFLKKVQDIRNGEDGRLDKWKHDTRVRVYAGLAWTVFCPPAAAVAYATAAGVLETEIAKYEATLDRLIQSCDQSASAAINLISKTDEAMDFLETEQELIQAWVSALSLMESDFKDVDSVVECVFLLNDEMVIMLDDLINACTNYKAHKMAE